MDLPLWKMSVFRPYLKLQFFGLKIIVFYPKYHQQIFYWLNFRKKTLAISGSIFEQNRWTNPFEKYPFIGPFQKFNFFLLKSFFFFPQYQKRSFLIWFLWITPKRKSSSFGQTPWTYPHGKCPFFGPI